MRSQNGSEIKIQDIGFSPISLWILVSHHERSCDPINQRSRSETWKTLSSYTCLIPSWFFRIWFLKNRARKYVSCKFSTCDFMPILVKNLWMMCQPGFARESVSSMILVQIFLFLTAYVLLFLHWFYVIGHIPSSPVLMGCFFPHIFPVLPSCSLIDHCDDQEGLQYVMNGLWYLYYH